MRRLVCSPRHHCTSWNPSSSFLSFLFMSSGHWYPCVKYTRWTVTVTTTFCFINANSPVSLAASWERGSTCEHGSLFSTIFVYLLASSLIKSGTQLFFFFSWQSYRNDEYIHFVVPHGIRDLDRKIHPYGYDRRLLWQNIYLQILNILLKSMWSEVNVFFSFVLKRIYYSPFSQSRPYPLQIYGLFFNIQINKYINSTYWVHLMLFDGIRF